LKVEPEKPAAAPEAEVRFPVKGFRFSGNTVVADSRLQELLAALIGKELSLTDLREAAQSISRLYRDEGYLVARAYLPPQDIKDGVVTIAILEGRYGGAELKNRSRVKDAVLRDHLEKVLDDKVVQQKGLDRGLLLMTDLPGVKTLSATLKPGAATGETILEIEASPSDAVKGAIEFDANGNRFTGQNRYSATLNWLSPTGYGDALGLRAFSTGRNLNSVRVTYQLPLGADGWKAGAGYSETRYRLGEEFSVLDASGAATVANVFVSYPLIRTQNFNLYGLLAYEGKQLNDRIGLLASVSDKRSTLYGLTLNGDARDAVGGGGINTFGLTYSEGDLDLETASVRLADSATARTHGRFSQLNFSLMRLQHLTDKTYLYVYANGQRASKNLDSSEKMSLGGASGVRAYPQGEAAGDEGYLATAELRHNLQLAGVAPTLQLVAFLDAGGIRINHNPFSPGANSRRLSAIGVGLNVVQSDDYQLRFSWAWKLRAEPAQSDNDRGGRGWVQLVKYF